MGLGWGPKETGGWRGQQGTQSFHTHMFHLLGFQVGYPLEKQFAADTYIEKTQKKEKEKPQDQPTSKALLAARLDDDPHQAWGQMEGDLLRLLPKWWGQVYGQQTHQARGQDVPVLMQTLRLTCSLR